MSNALFPALPGLTLEVLKTPMWNTVTQKSVGGMELRGSYYSTPIWQWTLVHEFLRADRGFTEFAALAQFFNARQGNYDSFLYNDPSDNAVAGHGFGVGDGATVAFPLQRRLGGASQRDYLGAWPSYSIPRQNLLTHSAVFTATSWTKTDLTIGTGPFGAPDGTNTAQKLVEDTTASALRSVQQSHTAPAGPVTFSVYLKAGERSFAFLDLEVSGAQQVTAQVNLATGAIAVTTGTPFAVRVVPLANGWVRASITTALLASSNVLVGVYLGDDAGNISYSGDGASGCFVWQAQLEPSAEATQPITTVATPITVTPPYWPGQGGGFEPVYDFAPLPVGFTFAPNYWDFVRAPYPAPRTNLVRSSDDFSNATFWSRTGFSAATPNAGEAPDGTYGATKMVENTSNSAHDMSQVIALIAGGATYTWSVFVLAAGRTKFQYNFTNGSTRSAKVIFDLVALTATPVVTGVGATVTAATITAYPNGWYRCAVTGTLNVADTVNNSLDLALINASGATTYVGDGVSGMVFWRAGLERGPLTAPIATTTTAVTAPAEYTGSPTVFVNGVLQVLGTDYTLANGMVTFAAAPAAAAVLTWVGGYSWRVRFLQELAEFEQFANAFWALKKIEFQSVKGS